MKENRIRRKRKLERLHRTTFQRAGGRMPKQFGLIQNLFIFMYKTLKTVSYFSHYLMTT